MLQKLAVLRLWLVACLALISTIALAQQRQVTGKVLGTEDNKPVAGATVTVKGTAVATQTDANGNFTLSVPTARKTLTVSYVGYQTTDVSIGADNNVSVSLRGSASSLNEVVVTGYSTQRKKDITGAVAVVNVGNMKQIPAGTGEEALQGQASGVTIVSSGQPGGASDLRIRGFTSLGNTQPLVIVDGVPGDLHDINVNDIESLQVLKDASASIYGVRGSNGVIIITTKKGRAGKARVTYDGYYGFTQPGKGWDLANPQQTADAIWLQQKNSGIANPKSKQYGSGATPVLPDYLTPTAGKASDSLANPATYNLQSNQITLANKAGTDWYHEIFKQAPMQSHTVTVSGGADKSSYLFSLGYLDQQGTLISTYLKRYSVRANTLFNIKDHIRVGENAYMFFKDNPTIGNQNEGNPISMAYREQPIIPVYDIMGNYAGTKSQDLGNAQNPVAIVKRRQNDRGYNWDIQGNAYAEVDFLKHFTARTSFGGSIDNFDYHYFTYTAYENAEGNTNTNSYTEGAGYNSSWTWNNTLTYTNTFGQHNVKALIGSEAINSFGRSLSGTRGNYFSIDPNYVSLNTGAPSGQTNAGGPYQSSIYSLFGRVDYSFADKYLLSGTVRRDGASVFASQNRYAVFPALSAAWRISHEDFMKGITFFNDLKIRYSWGKLGSISNINVTNPYTLYNSNIGNSYYDISGNSNTPQMGFYNNQLGNPGAIFEGDIIGNLGLDATILNNKIDFSIEYYKKKVSGLLYQAPILIFYGAASPPFVNVGNIQNTGVDANVTYHGSVGKDFKFDLTGTYTSYNNKIVSIPGNYLDISSNGSGRIGAFTRAAVGHPVGAFFGYKVLGLFQNADEVSKAPTQDGAAPGRFRYQDVNGDGKIDVNDRTFIGNPNPKFTYGLNISLSYKNFDFSTFIFGSYGNEINNYVKYWTDFPQVFKGAISKEAATNSWTPSNPGAKVPMLETSANFSNTSVFNSYYIEKGSYLRDKQMMLGYTFPGKTLSRYGIDRFRVYVQAANLFTITKYSGLDPELQASNLGSGSSADFGTDFGNYPHERSFLLGVSLGF